MTRYEPLTLHEPDAFRAFVVGLPATTLVEQWDAQVAKVGGKVFCLLGNASGDIVFKVNEIAFDGLVELEGIGQAPYFAKRQWVRVGPGALGTDLLAGYLTESHRMIAAKLTRKQRSELGL